MQRKQKTEEKRELLQAPSDPVLEKSPEEHEKRWIDYVLPCLSFLLCPILCWCSVYQVNVGQNLLVFRWGRYEETKTKPGIYWINSIGSSVRVVSTSRMVYNHPGKLKVLDSNGYPICVSGACVYSVENPLQACTMSQNYFALVQEMTTTTLRQVISRFPYESEQKHSVSLKSDGLQVQKDLVLVLQEKVKFAGLKIHSFELDEISYAPEIAPMLLVRQQAEADAKARKISMESIVDTAVEAVDRLETRGVKVQQEGREALVKTLLSSMVMRQQGVQPVFQIQ